MENAQCEWVGVWRGREQSILFKNTLTRSRFIELCKKEEANHILCLGINETLKSKRSTSITILDFIYFDSFLLTWVAEIWEDQISMSLTQKINKLRAAHNLILFLQMPLKKEVFPKYFEYYSNNPSLVLMKECLSLGVKQLSSKSSIATNIINDIIKGSCKIDSLMADSFSIHLSYSKYFWLECQSKWDTFMKRMKS